jgi:hypothetical protein
VVAPTFLVFSSTFAGTDWVAHIAAKNSGIHLDLCWFILKPPGFGNGNVDPVQCTSGGAKISRTTSRPATYPGTVLPEHVREGHLEIEIEDLPNVDACR